LRTPNVAHLKVAYLTGHYPKPSHTFIQREIAALRGLGCDILCASIRRPDASDLTGPEEVEAYAETFYVLSALRNPARIVVDNAHLLFTRPKQWLKTLVLASRSGRPGAKGMLWQAFYFLEAVTLARWILDRKAVHIHNHFGDSSANVAMLTSSLSGIPFSFTLHGPSEFFAPEAWRLDEKIARASLVICITHFARSQAMIFSDPEHWNKLKIIHCGVTPERYCSAEASCDGEGYNLLFVGRLTPLKGLRVLFSAFERVRATNPEITLSVIGDGPDRTWADAEAERIGGIKLLGFQSQAEVAAALSRAHALVLPSFAEGLPVVLMEALAAGRPVIATRIAGIAELVEDKVCGLLTNPGDDVALEAAMRALINNPVGARRMGDVGRARVRQEFNSRTEASRLLRLFRGEGGADVRPSPRVNDLSPTDSC
jgi:glycosyltransferase involved in cell wall biosynthesis